MKKIIIVGFVALLVILPNLASALSISSPANDLQAQINSLLAQIKVLQQKLAEQQGTSSGGFCYTFNNDLKIGDSGDDVGALQTLLMKETFDSNIPRDEYLGRASYGESTASAVSAFQNKYKSEILTPAGLSFPTGYVGGRTRAKLNSLYRCTNNVYVPPTTSAPVACATDAKLCSDGITYVSRTAPSCNFASCPAVKTQPLPTISYVSPTSAKAGDIITIYGTNLYGNIIVFDGNNLSTYATNYGYPNNSGNLMTFTVPSTTSVGSHTVQIEQKIIGGRSNSVSLDVVAPLQLPTISYISPTSVGTGGQVTIYGSNLYGNILIINGEVAPSWQYNSTLDPSGTTMIFNAPSSIGSHNIQVEQKIVGGRSNTVAVNVNP